MRQGFITEQVNHSRLNVALLGLFLMITLIGAPARGSSFGSRLVDTTGAVLPQWPPVIALDPLTDRPRLLYRRSTPVLAELGAGGWSYDATVPGYGLLVMDTLARPVVCYVEESCAIKVARRDGGIWIAETIVCSAGPVVDLRVTPVLNEPVALYCGSYFGHRDLRINFRTHIGWFSYNEFIVDDDPGYIPVDVGQVQTDVNQTRIAYVEQSIATGVQELRFANALSSSIALYHIGLVYTAGAGTTLGSVALAVDSVTANPRIAFVVRSANDTLCYAQWTGNEWQIDRLLASPSEIISAAAAVAPNRESHIVVTTADNKNPYHCMAIYMHGTVPLFINKGGVATECFNCFDYDTVMYWRAGADLISPTALALTRAGVPLVAYNAEFCSGLGECSGSIMLAQRRPTVSVESPSNAVVASGLNVAAIGFPAASGALRLAIQSSLTQAVMIDVYDIQGRAAATERIVRVVPGVAGYDVQVGHLGRGVYFLRARGSREGATTTKLVVAR